MSSSPPPLSPQISPPPSSPAPARSKTNPAAPFLRGGISGVISWLAIHPADVVKVRMQLAGESPSNPHYRTFSHALRSIARTEGVAALYSGLSAALTRQVTYTTLRLGLYASLRDAWAERHGSVSVAGKFVSGTLAGAVASAVSTPVEVSMVRMYNDGAAKMQSVKPASASTPSSGSGAQAAAAPVARHRGYRNIADALFRIAREEGVRGLWSGATPTIVRSMVVNCVQLGTYDVAKERILLVPRATDGVGVHLVASTVSGFCYSVATLPIDSAKTRLQNQHQLPDGSFEYRNLAHAVLKVSREEGVLALWRGFMPYFSRCAGAFFFNFFPYTLLLF